MYFMCFYGAQNIETVIEVSNARCSTLYCRSQTLVARLIFFSSKSQNTSLIVLLFQTMTHAAYVYDIEHVIVDNLQFMTSYVRYRFMLMLNVLDTAGQMTISFPLIRRTLYQFFHPKKLNFAISFQPWRRSIFYPESCYFSTEEFCKHQKRACYVGNSPKKGLLTCTFKYSCLYVTYTYPSADIQHNLVSNCGFLVRRTVSENAVRIFHCIPTTSLWEIKSQ